MEEASLTQFQQMRMAGILPISVSPTMAHLQHLRGQGMPVVSLARRWEEGDYVTVDYFAGGAMAGRHLLGLGHQAIACVAHRESIRGGLWERIQGFKTALNEHGSVFSAERMIWVEEVGVRAGMKAADAFLALPDRPTAVFVTADQLAIGFIHRLQEQGVRVPRDVAVVGHDDIRFAEFMEVPLTTVALPKYEIGETATRILLQRVRADADDTNLCQVRLEPELVVRTSCGALG